MARTKGKGRPKYLPLQPKKTQVFKTNHLESHPPETPCLDIVLSADGDTVGNRIEDDSVGMQPISYLLPSPKTPSLHSIVPLSPSRTVSISKTKRRTTSYYLNRKKIAALSDHFNPIPFLREKPSSFANHRILLAQLGLWNFLHLDFGHNIHSDLIKQLIVHYNPKKPANRRTHVNGCAIMVSRAAFARALSLPSKRLNLNFNGTDAANTGPFVVSDEEAVFLDELVCSWLVLQDDGCELPGEVLKVKFLIKEKRLEKVDWAGLIWFMARSELLKGVELVNCHYASHMQFLLKNQKPQLFVDHVRIAGFLNAEAVSCDVASGEPKVVKKWEKERILDVGDNDVVVEESSSTYQQISLQKEDGNGNLKVLSVDVKDDEIKTAEDLFPGNSGEFLDGQEKKLTVDFKCNKKKPCEGKQADLEFGSSSDMIMNEHCCDKRLKAESSGDFTAKGMHVLSSKLESQFEPMDLDSDRDNGEKEFALDDFVENCRTTSHKLCTSNELDTRKMELSKENFKWLLNLATEVMDGNTEVLLLHHEDARKLSEGLGKEEIFDRRTTGNLIDSQEEEEVNNDTKCKQMDYNQQQLACFQEDDGADLEICFSSEKSTMDGKNQHTKIAMEDKEPERSGLNEILGTDMDLQNKNTFKSSSFVEPFVLQQEIRFSNSNYSPLDKSLKREIDCLNDRQLECQVNVSNYSATGDESFDMDCCFKQVELWISRLKNAAAAKMYSSKSRVLLKEIETKNQMIQLSERRRIQEQRKYQKAIYRLEREVYSMKNILDEYRTALNEIDKSFSEYRKRAKLPDEEEPIYVDHPDGGGEVVLARELISSDSKQGRENQ